jgi:hypothetical protein
MMSALIVLIHYIVEKYIYYASVFNLTFGVIGNLCLILTFTSLRIFRRNQCAFFLTVESVADIGFFLSNLPSYFFGYVTGQNPELTSLVWCKLQTALSQIFGVGSLFTICFLTFDQFMSTNPRLTWRQISTLKLARYLTLFNICFVILHSIPFLIFTQIDSLNGCTIYNTALQAYLTFFYYPILSSTLPIILTITFSLLAYRNVRRIVRRQIPLVRRRLDQQLTAMVLARVFCLILLGLPYIFYSMIRVNLHIPAGNQLEAATVSLASTICFSLLYTNFAVK